MLTARGVGLLLTAIFLFLLGGATNVGWVRIVDAVLWGMLGLSLILQWLSVAAVGARRRILDVMHSGRWTGPMEDDVLEIGLEIENRWFWPRFFVSASYDAPVESPDSRPQRFFVANLKGHGVVKLSSRVRCYRRGLHHFGPVTIESLVPFGLFRRRKRVDAPLSILVYPRAYPITRMALPEGARGESQRPRRARVGQEVIGSRPYFPGDPLRFIHWRNTARAGRLTIKELEDTTERELTIVLDVRKDLGQGRETTMEYAVKLAATIGLHAISSGESVRLIGGGGRGEWTDPVMFLEELALMQPSEALPPDRLLQDVPDSSSVIALVGAADAGAIAALAAASHSLSGLTVVVIGGFGEDDEPETAAAALKSSGVPTVVCRQGRLTEAVDTLEQTGDMAESLARLQSEGR